ncbi:phosphoadenosine phosphosulfate reductase family protein [Aliarcobacter thereius]|uniref:Phosphoadenosine phosphosulfate reductase family protein n=1 Tax=Aliarcobacter thereius TaxID=544718 RepID=A0A5R9HBU6_9BACT|nr:phosphoadenosine phosphosulfate reductase family protein [Aliarcobacter thereius]TLS72147.1 phosphoadenosine phosphosulfate reductase family protein [Aliarcobacter thereius]
MKNIILVSVSGGKDSQAVLNYCLSKYPKNKLIAYFCDTGWEADETYDHIKYLEDTLKIEIIRVKSDKYDGFEDMCIKRKSFPSRVRRFCTEELKIIPSTNFIRSYIKKGFKVKNYVGVRKEESVSKKLTLPKIVNGVKLLIAPKRDIENKYKTTFLGLLPKPTKRKDGSYSYPKKAKEFYSKQNAVTTVQPIIDWKEKEVYLYNIKSGTKNNPLYSKGCTRVGCYPCINANNNELGMLQEDRINRVVELEKKVQAVNKRVKPVFLHKKKGELKSFDHYCSNLKFNTLGLDLGCINHLGICE